MLSGHMTFPQGRVTEVRSQSQILGMPWNSAFASRLGRGNESSSWKAAPQTSEHDKQFRPI